MSATDRRLAAQTIRAVTNMKTVSPAEVLILRRVIKREAWAKPEVFPDALPHIQFVLETYEKRQVWQAGHGDVPLKLRRAIRLLEHDRDTR